MSDVTPCWRELGVALGFSTTELDTIEKGCFWQPKDCIQRLFGEWAKSKDSYSWSGLVEALRDAGFNDLADRVDEAVSSFQ